MKKFVLTHIIMKEFSHQVCEKGVCMALYNLELINATGQIKKVKNFTIGENALENKGVLYSF